MTISDFQRALSVVDRTNDLPVTWEDPRTIRERDPLLEDTGTPESWYIAPDGQFTVYPVDDNAQINIWYLREAVDLANDSDEPLWPDRFHYVLVDAAVAEAYKDTDNFEAYGNITPIVQQGVTAMRNVVMLPNYDTPNEIAPSFLGSTDW